MKVFLTSTKVVLDNMVEIKNSQVLVLKLVLFDFFLNADVFQTKHRRKCLILNLFRRTALLQQQGASLLVCIDLPRVL